MPLLISLNISWSSQALLLSPNKSHSKKVLIKDVAEPSTVSRDFIPLQTCVLLEGSYYLLILPPPPKASKAAAICIPRHASLPQKLTASFSLLLYTSEAADGLLSYCWGVNLSCVKLSVLKEAVSVAVVLVTVCSVAVLEISHIIHSYPATGNQGLEPFPRLPDQDIMRNTYLLLIHLPWFPCG